MKLATGSPLQTSRDGYCGFAAIQICKF